MTSNIEPADARLVAHMPGFCPRTEMEARSTAFTAGEWLPRKFTQEGENVSPPVIWSNLPDDAKELVLICEDPNAPLPKPFVHWLLYGIPPRVIMLPEDIRSDSPPEILKGARQGKNSKGQIGYIGPLPPIADGPHFYHFQIFALSKQLALPQGIELPELLAAMEGTVIAQATFIGIYERFGTLG